MITFTRGDTQKIKFKRTTSTGQTITDVPDKMYVTFKKKSTDKKAVFQKTLDNDISFNETTNYYSFTINPTDTNDLEYGKYYFDIEIINDDEVKTILKDSITITDEITDASNEV